MDRIRRKLGDDVPVELVFPDTDDDDQVTFTQPVSRTPTIIHIRASVDNDHVTSTPLPSLPPTPRPTRARSTGIHSARDSIVSSSAHRGHRVRRKPVPKLEPTRPAPPPPVNADRPLSLILENPQERDYKSRRQPTSPASEWFSEDDGIEQWIDYLKMTQQ
ncbi:hypothetical protein MPER_04120 [Moniliophthora perniciosa FA553]|nr:hypothetical protein MPER_04120 [Moniliophthora perniciosa FA553]